VRYGSDNYLKFQFRAKNVSEYELIVFHIEESFNFSKFLMIPISFRHYFLLAKNIILNNFLDINGTHQLKTIGNKLIKPLRKNKEVCASTFSFQELNNCFNCLRTHQYLI
jgi:hypothetical protein